MKQSSLFKGGFKSKIRPQVGKGFSMPYAFSAEATVPVLHTAQGVFTKA